MSARKGYYYFRTLCLLRLLLEGTINVLCFLLLCVTQNKTFLRIGLNTQEIHYRSPRVDKFISSIYIFYSGLKFKQQLQLHIMSWLLSNLFNYFVNDFSSNGNWNIIIFIYILYTCIHIPQKMLIWRYESIMT